MRTGVFLPANPKDPDRLPDELEIALTEIDIRIAPEFLSQAWRLPLLRDLQRPFTRWLLAFGVEQKRAAHIAAQLPQRFGYCLWDEWARHRDTYQPLEQALMVPVQRPPNLERLRRAYLTYLRDSYRFLDLKGLPGVVEAVEKGSGLALSEIYVSIHGGSERPDGETWLRSASGAGELPRPPAQRIGVGARGARQRRAGVFVGGRIRFRQGKRGEEIW